MRGRQITVNKIKTFTDLITWQKGHSLVLQIYKMTKKLPKDELYCLTSQMRRSVISIISNIAEGFGRISTKDKLRFYYISQGSIVELKNQLLITRDVGYINDDCFDKLALCINEVHKLLQGLIVKMRNKNKNT